MYVVQPLFETKHNAGLKSGDLMFTHILIKDNESRSITRCGVCSRNLLGGNNRHVVPIIFCKLPIQHHVRWSSVFGTLRPIDSVNTLSTVDLRYRKKDHK